MERSQSLDFNKPKICPNLDFLAYEITYYFSRLAFKLLIAKFIVNEIILYSCAMIDVTI